MKLFFAYLDAGTGSVVIQAIIGGVVAVGVFLKAFWGRLSSPFRRHKSKTDTNPKNSNQTANKKTNE